MMGMDPMEMGMRPGSEIMMAMCSAEGGMRSGGGPVMMGMNPGGDGMRPGPDMMGEVRMRPGSAAMMMGMVPGSEGGQVMGMGPPDGGMIMVGGHPGGGEMMGLNPGDFDPRGCPPEMMNAQRIGQMGPRMMSPCDPGIRYDGAGPMRMNRPRGELDFRMMPGMDPGMRGGPYGGPGMRNGSVGPPSDRQQQMMMMMMNAGPNSGGGPPVQPGEFGPGMGPPMSTSDGAQFQQFQQQLYATKGHQQQGPPSPMMMDARGAGPGGNFGFDPMSNGPPVRFGPPGSGVM